MIVRWLGHTWQVEDRREYNSKLPPAPDPRPAFVLSRQDANDIKVYEHHVAYAFIEERITA